MLIYCIICIIDIVPCINLRPAKFLYILNSSLDIRLRRIVRLVHLQGTFNTLYQTKKHREAHNQCYRKPEVIPLNWFSSVSPPLLHGFWLGIIKGFLQDGEAFMPVLELLNLSILWSQVVTICRFNIKT